MRKLRIPPLAGDYYQRADAYVNYHGPLTVVQADVQGLLKDERLEELADFLRAKGCEKQISRLTLILAETLATLGDVASAKELALRVAAAYAEDPDVWALLGWLELNQGRALQASTFFSKALGLNSNHPMASVNHAFTQRLIKPAASAGAPNASAQQGRVCVGTSIPPKDIPTHQACVQTWLDAGFEVLSLNPAAELDSGELQKAFPQVSFVPATRDGRETFGKPVIYIADLIEALVETGADVLGIVNADIVLAQSGGLKAHLLEHCQGAMVFCPRVDLPQPDAPMASLNGCGFDAFFFGASVGPDLSDSGFCIGIPWWDVFFPYAFVLAGVETKLCASPLVYHLDHDMQWSTQDYYRLGLRFLQMTSAAFGPDFGGDVLKPARGCDIGNLKNLILAVDAVSVQTLFSGCGAAYYHDPLYAGVLAPLDVSRHLAYQSTLLVLKSEGGKSPYEAVLTGSG